MPLPVDANSVTRLSWLEDFFSYLITPNIKAQVDGHGELKCHIPDTILIKYCRPFQWIWSENADGSGAARSGFGQLCIVTITRHYAQERRV